MWLNKYQLFGSIFLVFSDILIRIETVNGQLPNRNENLELLDIFGSNKLFLSEFLSLVSGVIKFGNHTFNLPQDLSKLLGQDVAKRRSFNNEDEDEGRFQYQMKIKQSENYYGEGWNGWGWDKDKTKEESGLISFGNLLRAGCIILDLAEIKKSAQNGLF